MAFLSRTTGTGDGVTQTITISWSYLDESHVKVYVDDVEDTTFTFDSATVIRFTSIPANNADLLVKRITNRSTREVDFEDASNINEADLDTSALQMFYLAQEAIDEVVGVMGLDSTNTNWDAESNKIINLANGTASSDAVSLGQVQGLIDTDTTLSYPTSVTTQNKILVVNSTTDGFEESASAVGALAYLSTVDTAQIAADAIDGTKIEDDAVDSEHIAAGAIDNEHLADNVVDVDEMAHGTQGDMLYYGASGAPSRVGIGTVGQVWTSDGTDASWDDLPAGNGWELVSTETPSTETTTQFTGLSSTYKHYMLKIRLTFSIDGADPLLTLNSDTGASDYSWGVIDTGSTSTDDADSNINLLRAAVGVGNDTNEYYQGTVIINNPAGTDYTSLDWYSTHTYTTGIIYKTVGGGRRLSAAATTTVEVTQDSGTHSGTIELWGLRA